jgi:hypothetical protein
LGAGRSGSAAVVAAREWAYKTTTLNCIPTKVEIVLTFTFATMALNNRCINHVLFKDQIGRRMRA